MDNGSKATEEQLRLLQAIIEQQKMYIQAQDTRMAEKDATIADLRKLVDELQSLKANLEETLAEFRRQFFGVRSEKAGKKKPEEAPQENESPDGLPTVEVKGHTRTRKPKATREELYANLPVTDVLIPLSDDQRRCEWCNSEMVTIGYTEVREELRITPAKVERIR